MKSNLPHYILVSVLAALSLFLTGSQVFAQRLVLKPHIQADWQIDNNFGKTETEEKTVHTYTVQPGLDFGYTTDKTLMTLDYTLKRFMYDDKDENIINQRDADEYDYTGHNAVFRFKTMPTQRLELGLDNTFMKTRDPAASDANDNSIDRYKYNLNRFAPRVVYNFGEKFNVALKYTNLLTDYSDDDLNEGEDSVENRGGLTWSYNLTPKTSFNLDYQIWKRDYDKNTSDYTSNQLMLNVKRQVNYLTFGVGMGIHNRDFDKNVASGDIDDFVWKVSVLGQNPPDARSIPKHSIYLSIGSNLNDSGSGDTYYESMRLDARLTYLAMERLNCILSGYFQNSDYETSSREDDRWLISLGADYLINPFFTVGLSGGYEERDSNFPGKDFDNQYLMLKAKFNYDFAMK
jgi:hypothetical protein